MVNKPKNKQTTWGLSRMCVINVADVFWSSRIFTCITISVNSKHLTCTKPLAPEQQDNLPNVKGRPGHVHNLLCMIWYLPVFLKATPLHHSSQARPEEIQDFKRTNGPLAVKCSRNGGDWRDCCCCCCCFIIYFIPPHGQWCRKRFHEHNHHTQLFLLAISVNPVYSCDEWVPRIATHQGAMCEMTGSRHSPELCWGWHVFDLGGGCK